MKHCFFVLVAISAILLLAVPAFAGMLALDQVQEDIDGAARVYSTRELCQTFTPGMTGYLEKVSISLSGLSDEQAPATVSILGTTGDNLPDDSNVLWTGTYNVLAPGWFDVDTSASAPFLVSGIHYGIKLTSSDSVSGNPDDVWDMHGTTDVYSGGKLWEKRTGGWQTLALNSASFPNSDAAFRTYMAVPEPATISLLCIGLLCFLSSGNLRRSK
jgi:hypothetical protein